MKNNSAKIQVSVCIITFNEEDRIKDCLESVGWADEIIVIDSYSTDKTVEICKEYTDNVFLNKWPGFRKQRGYALDKASNNWVLCLDADERVSKELAQAINEEFTTKDIRYNGFFFRRHSYYLGRLINHGGWYPDYKLRLFRKDTSRCEGIDPHDKIVVQGPKKYLKKDIIHYPYRSISDQLKTIDSYSTLFADEMIRDGRKFNILQLFIRPPTRFLETYIWKKGFLDGLPGLINILIASFYVFLKYLKWYERKKS
ncbi:MAG: glycosyltransferase family 2 protein [Candidatus Anammoxibacter sp.]